MLKDVDCKVHYEIGDNMNAWIFKWLTEAGVKYGESLNIGKRIMSHMDEGPRPWFNVVDNGRGDWMFSGDAKRLFVKKINRAVTISGVAGAGVGMGGTLLAKKKKNR